MIVPGTAAAEQVLAELARSLAEVLDQRHLITSVISVGEVELRVPIEGNATHRGPMYAGVHFAIAELPGGLIPPAASRAGGRYTPIVTGMELQLVAAARPDVTLTARMDPLRPAGARRSWGRRQAGGTHRGPGRRGRTRSDRGHEPGALPTAAQPRQGRYRVSSATVAEALSRVAASRPGCLVTDGRRARASGGQAVTLDRDDPQVEGVQ